MASRAIRVALLLSSLPIVGCGTVVNVVRPGPEQGGKIPFGGVKQDVSCIKKAETGELGCATGPRPEQRPQMAPLLLCAADLPFSLVGDLVTLPYTAAYSWINQPVPVPPVAQAPPLPPPPPVPHPPVVVQPQTPPQETLPEPKKSP